MTRWPSLLTVSNQGSKVTKCSDHEDVEKYRPGTIAAFRQWWTYYKVARGDDIIPIVGGGYQNSTFARDVVNESHGFWRDLVMGQVDSNAINFNQTSRPDVSQSFVQSSSATKTFDIPSESKELPAQPKPSKYNDWYYLAINLSLISVA